jgi:sulfoxide reductase catalytic subunit YedY
MSKIPDSEITPQQVYFNRRQLLRAGILAGSAAGTAALYSLLKGEPMEAHETRALEGVTKARDGNSGFVLAEDQTPYQAITTYNNFYEFTTSKTDVARLAEDFKTDGWRLSVEGMVHSPRQFSVDDLRRVPASSSVMYFVNS